MIITFVGHSFVADQAKVKEAVKNLIREIIVTSDTCICYLGGYGEFDELCAGACRELKAEGKNLQTVYVTPYLSEGEQGKIKELQRLGLFDLSVYPPIENVPKKYAILKRNEWMIRSADTVISYSHLCVGNNFRDKSISWNEIG
jgi:hypothetical protein